ncbi:DNA-binding GntR family transcriptional regulator [Kribbella orskensis]|uniref:DNA-binding GntR family transcriptional regulator n=2 Tax=Kribbellaceae TaxID=2726069 RepID=A0ABY2BDN2_9ACTN|nr:DNA-binding GntR family transcriptional regulator [Kribbella sp. VKM Ac-2500]TCO17105.1 DNA-binding GntR family transcriptional regulator [Kribbella orskensis]
MLFGKDLMTTISAGPDSTSDSPGVRHVKRPTPLRESVYEALTEMIIDGTLERGRHLVEVELAGMLGVSRQPVREALQRLNNEGWVDLRPGFGAMVHVPAEDEVDQLLAARAALESESARLAARNPDKDAVAKLRDLCKIGASLQESGDIDGAVRTNAELHGLITEMSGNRFLVDFAGQVDRRVRWYYTPVAPVRGAASWREHSRLVKAISDGDEDKAAQIMREHTEHTRKAYHDLRSGATPEEGLVIEKKTTRRRRSAE